MALVVSVHYIGWAEQKSPSMPSALDINYLLNIHLSTYTHRLPLKLDNGTLLRDMTY